MIGALYDFLLLAATVLAFRLGRFEERVAAATMVIASVLSIAVTDIDTTYRAVDPRLFAIDGATLIVFVILACLSNRFWPIWAASLQLLIVTANVVPLFAGSAHPLAYALNEQLWAWPLIALIGVAAVDVRNGENGRSDRSE